jgi:RPA family protein
MITEHLNCSIEELISDKMLIDVKVFNTLQEMTESENIESVRIFIPIEEYIPNLKNEFFSVRTEIIKSLDIEVCRLYSTTTSINSEGTYAVNYQGKTTELNIISTSSKFVIAELDSQEIRIPQEALEPIAKFVKTVLLFKSNNDYLQGFKE